MLAKYGPGIGYRFPPADEWAQQFEDAYTAMAKYFDGKVTYWEFGNEVKLYYFFTFLTIKKKKQECMCHTIQQLSANVVCFALFFFAIFTQFRKNAQNNKKHQKNIKISFFIKIWQFVTLYTFVAYKILTKQKKNIQKNRNKNEK